MSETALLLSRKAADVLAGRGIAQPRLEAELLLADVLGISRLQLYLQHDRPLTDSELARFRGYVRRRLAREPVQYILGRVHFRELDLAVDRRVLIPRPETEELVGAVLDWAWSRVGGRPAGRGAPPSGPAVPGSRGSLTAADIGSGSGAIALSLAREGPFARVVATDSSAEALQAARANATRLGLAGSIEFRAGALWQPLAAQERFDVIVSNPPYVADAERGGLAPEVLDWEPPGALFAGAAGLDVLGPLIEGAAAHLRQDGLLALEIGATQGAAVLQRAEQAGTLVAARIGTDLAGRDRMLLAQRRSLASEEERGEHA